MSRLPSGCASICSLPFGWLGFLSLALSGSVLVVAGAILGWHGQGSWLNFIFNVLNFTQPPHFTFTFSYSSCCHHPALLPDHGMPPWDLLPPSAAPLRRRPLGILSISSHLPPKSAPSLEQIVSHSIVGKSILTNILSFLVYSISDSFYSIFPSWQSSL